jgi:HD superfamily phosphohydrolases
MIKGKLVYWGFIKDPIYGYINITEEDKKLIDTPFFQRLRRVRQVPLIDYVYPSAVHTRFEHSLGVAHLAMNIMANLPIEIDEYEAKMIRSASLLHDIGHGPFSHLFEVILIKYFGLNHEQVGREIIIRSEISDILNDIGLNPKDIGNLITGEAFSFKKYLQQIVKSGIDADKLDFIKRDNFHSGAGYGNIDIDRLVNTMEIYEENLAINMTALHTFELFLLARVKSFEAMYFHRTLRIAQLMLLRALEKFIEKNGFPTKLELDEYLKLDDMRLWIKLAEDDSSKDIMKRLERRDLIKEAFEKKFLSKESLNNIAKELENIKNSIVSRVNIREDDLYIDLSILPSVPYHGAYSYDPFEIPVVKVEGSTKVKYSLTELSPWVESIKGYLNIVRIYTENKYRIKVEEVCKKLFKDFP